ncbi:MAG: LysM peptidoglycan-binding domain-containing protein [Chloroflexi bacterium]|nr:LysM peptidoglycan-binding domain-containing protein [Chloroflexota bacterium]
MVDEPSVEIKDEDPKLCPACGSRVAALAKTCLMCGASLEGQDESSDSTTEEAPRRLPGWVRALTIVGLALIILGAGGFGVLTLMNRAPEEAPPTSTPTRTAIPTRTPTSTPTPTITPTPTQIPPRVHQVQSGETLSGIAAEYGVASEAIMRLNPALNPELIQPGEVILIPPDLSQQESETEDAAPTPGEVVLHVVASGETLSEIAEEYGVSVELLRLANDLAEGNDTIRPNQSLQIPIGTPAPTATPTVDPNATPTPVPPFPAPPLLNPFDGQVLTGTERPVLLEWASVAILGEDEWYEVRLADAGQVVSDTYHTRGTAWRVPYELLQRITGNTGDESYFEWNVRIVRSVRQDRDGPRFVDAGAPSPARTFLWLAPTPTPEPSPTSGS